MINNADGDEKEKYIKELKHWMSFYQLVSSNSYVSGITKYLRTLLADDKFPEMLNALKGKLAFKNGIMDLETKTFRHRYDTVRLSSSGKHGLCEKQIEAHLKQ